MVLGDKCMDKFAPATCELFGHLVFKGNKKYIHRVFKFYFPNLWSIS